MAMVDLNGHEAGNGGYSQGTPTAHRVLLYSESEDLILPKGHAMTGQFSARRCCARRRKFFVSDSALATENRTVKCLFPQPLVPALP
jgi:hypothetical protein